MNARTIGCALLLACYGSPLGAGERLEMRVSPLMAFAPAHLVVQTTVAADAANRRMEIVAESDEFYRSSETDLEGERAPRTSVFEFRSLPGGEYDVQATLFGVGGQTLASVRRHVRVITTDR